MDSQFDVEIGVNRRVLTALGVWPDLTKKRHSTVYLRFVLCMVLTLGFCNIPQTTKLLEMKNDFDDILDNISRVNLPIAMATFRMASLWHNYQVISRNKAIGELLVSMARGWNQMKTKADFRTMKRYAKISRLATIVLLWIFDCTAVALLFSNFYIRLKEAKAFEQGKINASDRVRPLYMSSQFVFDVQKSPYYEVTWILQFLTTFVSATGFAAIDGFFAALVLHLCAQFKNLRRRFEPVLSKATEQSDRLNDLDISEIVERHEYLVWFADIIKDVINIPLLLMLISSALILCLSGYQIVMVTTQNSFNVLKLIFAVYYYLCFSSSLLIYCFIAMLLSTESVKLRETAYNIEWYELSPSNARLLILIMIRTRKPLELTAGKFVALSLELYCSIMKTSGGYLSMLLAMENRLAPE